MSVPDSLDLMHEDLGRILDALALGDHARPHSPHDVVQREVLPAIEQMMDDAYRWRCSETQQDAHFHDAEAQAAQPDRPEPVDPASVQVGDVVEIEGDDWMVRAPVVDLDNLHHDGPRYPESSPFGVRINQLMWWPVVTDATVRVLRRADPDPEQVRAWVQWLVDNGAGCNGVAETLVRAGLEVPSHA